MSKNFKLNTKLKDYEIKNYASQYALTKHSDGLLLLSTILIPIFAYGLVFIIDRILKYCNVYNGIWYLPIIFAGASLIIMLTISIISCIKKSLKLKAILKNIPKEDLEVFKILVKCELQKLDEEETERNLRSLQRQINLTRSTYSEYEINKANEKEEKLKKQQIDETLNKLNDELNKSSTSYELYDKNGNYIGRADKK